MARLSRGGVVASDDRGLSAFRPIQLRTAADEVVAVLVNAIGGGLYRAGDLLPRERDLAEQLGVSRTVVREAIGLLRRAGVVSVRRGVAGGAMVISLAPLPQILSELHAPSKTTIQGLLEARRPLELAAAVFASQRATPSELAEVWAELIDPLSELLEEPEQFLALDVRFHLTLPKLGRSPVIEELIGSVLTRLVAALSQYPFGHVADLERAIENQRGTMDAVVSGDVARIEAAVDSHMAMLEGQFLGHPLATG
ncbi:MAG: FadR/GntR family transcriptional regulator [Vicinamibacterales bacterium]